MICPFLLLVSIKNSPENCYHNLRELFLLSNFRGTDQSRALFFLSFTLKLKRTIRKQIFRTVFSGQHKSFLLSPKAITLLANQKIHRKIASQHRKNLTVPKSVNIFRSFNFLPAQNPFLA